MLHLLDVVGAAVPCRWFPVTRSGYHRHTRAHAPGPASCPASTTGAPVTVNERTIRATPEEVWSVLADGWLFPLWVVGATRMRDVEPTWPEAGAVLHHSVGVWPAVINDHTEVVAADPGKRLELRAKGWPIGEADVVLELRPAADGTRISISEKPSQGPGLLVPPPVVAPLMKWRNTETLRRLAHVVEGRSGH